MKNVFIVSELPLYNTASAGAARMTNVAKALALRGVRVYLCSKELNTNVNIQSLSEIYPNIFLVGSKNSRKISKFRRIAGMMFNLVPAAIYLHKVFKLSERIEGEKVFYVYPHPAVSVDVVSVLYGKFIKKYAFFADINELRLYMLEHRRFPGHILWKAYLIGRYWTHFVKYHLLERLTKHYDGLVVISTNLEKYFVRYNKNLLRVPILSDTTETPYQESPPFANGDAFSICFTGMVARVKEGFEDFYKALSRVKSHYTRFVLNLYGPIDKRDRTLLLRDLPQKYKIQENVVYHGVVDRNVLMKEMHKSHLLVIPRPRNLQTHYGFSTKLAEYLVSGVPSLITDVSDNALYIKDGQNGFIVPPGDYEKMTAKIVYIIANYARLKDSVGKNAYQTARDDFDYTNHSEKLFNFLFGSNANP